MPPIAVCFLLPYINVAKATVILVDIVVSLYWYCVMLFVI